MGPFKKKWQAKRERDRLKDKPVGYCPLARIDCIPRCVCYGNARIQSHVPGSAGGVLWYAYEPYCNNTMFWGHE